MQVSRATTNINTFYQVWVHNSSYNNSTPNTVGPGKWFNLEVLKLMHGMEAESVWCCLITEESITYLTNTGPSSGAFHTWPEFLRRIYHSQYFELFKERQRKMKDSNPAHLMVTYATWRWMLIPDYKLLIHASCCSPPTIPSRAEQDSQTNESWEMKIIKRVLHT